MEQPLTHPEPSAGDALSHDLAAQDAVAPDALAHDALARAAARLEHAVASLEAALGEPADKALSIRADTAGAPPDAALQEALQAALGREGELQEAAAVASRALGRAMAEVRLTLQADEAAPEQGLLDLALESAPQSLEDDLVEDGDAAPRKEPAP